MNFLTQRNPLYIINYQNGKATRSSYMFFFEVDAKWDLKVRNNLGKFE